MNLPNEVLLDVFLMHGGDSIFDDIALEDAGHAPTAKL